MSRLEDPPVGEHIREERTKRGISLRHLARSVGVSASLISQIETGKCRPSVGTLYALTTALGVSIEDVFEARGDGPGALIGATGAGSCPAPAGPLATLAAVAGPLARPGEREVLELDSGVTWERLGHVPGGGVDFLLVTYAPGASSSAAGDLMRHSGAEYGYLLDGELVVTLGSQEHRLTAGTSVSFSSSTPHRYANDTRQPTVGVWFVSA